MKIHTHSQSIALALGALALLGGSFMAAPARAQDTVAGAAAANKPVTLNLQNVPIQTALKLLFSGAGIRQYTIATDVQGLTNISVNDVPFSTALNRLLASANPPAAFTVENGFYNVTVKRAAPAPPTTVEQTTLAAGKSGSASETAGHIYGVIPINRYDAYIIAELLGAQGIVPVPSNEVMASSSSGQNGQQGGGYGGQQGGGYGGQQSGSYGGQQGGYGRGGGGGGYGGGGGGYGGGGGGYGRGGGGGGYGGGRPFSLIYPQ